MKLNIIYDDRRSEKYHPLMDELERQGIDDFEIFPCIVREKVLESITTSFKMIVQSAKNNQDKEVAIAEDDILFPHKKGWEYFLKNKPDDYDVYISGTYYINKPEEYKPPLIKVKEWVGNHLIIVNEKYYDTFLALPDNAHCDTANSGRGDFYVCFPFAALQRPSYSANNKAMVNYNSMLKPEWVYGELPQWKHL